MTFYFTYTRVAGANEVFGDGVQGQALRFDGSTGVSLPEGLINSYQYSVSLWVNPETITQFTTAFFGATSPNSWLSFVPERWDNNTMLWSGDAWFDGSAGERIAVEQWSHLVFTVDNGDITVYINGEEKFVGSSFTDLFSTSTGTVSLGVNYWNTPFNGLIDELRSILKCNISDRYFSVI